MDIKELQKDFNTAWVEMKGLIETQDKEIKKYGEATGETKSAIDKINEKLNELEVKMNRPGASSTKESENAQKSMEQKGAFDIFARKGKEQMTPEQVKTMIAGDDTTGGYLTMPEVLAGEMIQDITVLNPFRSIARVRSTTARSVKIRKKTGTPTAQWVGEVDEKADTQDAYGFGMVDLPVHEMSALVDISNQDLEDTGFNLEGDLRADMSEQFAILEGKAFITGNATNKPEGILYNGNVGITKSAHASQLTSDSMIGICYDLKSTYANNGLWILNRNTLKIIRQMKDGQNNYLWQPSFQAGAPATILGRPYIECVDMPDIAANATPVAFGDFKRGYLIVDRIIIEILRDPYTKAKYGAVEFIARKRVGGQVIQPEAFRKLKITT